MTHSHHSRRLLALCLPLTWVALAHGPALGEPSSNERLAVGGDAAQAAKTLSYARSWFSTRTHAVAAIASPGPILECLAQKSAAQCKPLLLGAHRLWTINVEVDVSDSGVDIALTGRLFSDQGEVLGSERLVCERCYDDALRQTTESLMLALERAANLPASSSTVLLVESNPSNATVRIDGKQVGKTNLRHYVVPGQRTISVQLDGYVPAGQTVDIIHGETRQVRFDLHRSEPRSHKRLIAWSLLGFGGAALLSGGALVLTHDEPMGLVEGTRDDSYRDRKSPGLWMMGAGAIAAGVGGYLVFKTRARPKGVALTASWSGHTVGLAVRY